MPSAHIALVAFAAALVVTATSAQVPPPPPPLPDPSFVPAVPQITPPAGPAATSDPDLDTQITILKREDNVVEEFRIKGELRYVKVTPRHGRPYYLIPDGSGYTYLRRDSLDISLKVPMWVLFSF